MKTENLMYRVVITYTGKYAMVAKRVSTAFCKAISKEQAEEFIVKQVRAALIQHGYPNATFNVKTVVSSQDEVDFFLRNRDNKNYSGAIN